jgi:hypothetical protein
VDADLSQSWQVVKTLLRVGCGADVNFELDAIAT